MYVMMREVDRD